MISRLLVPLLIASQLPSSAEEEEENKNDILSRLPIGATATNVTIPSFDKFKKRASLLTAKTVVVEKEAERSEGEESIVLFAKGIEMFLFDKEEKMNATGTLVSGKYSLENEQLNAEGKIHLKSTDDAFEIQSQGGIFQLPTRQGLFLGPGLTLFSEPPKTKTAMNLHPLLPLLAGLQTLIAAPPPEITAEELSHFERMVAPRFIPASQAIQIEENAHAANAGLTRRLAEYLASANKMDLLLQAKAPALATTEKKKDLKEGQTSIEFDGGAYFDGDNFEMVYLGNISLQQMDMSLTCNKDLKVLFDPPPEEESTDEKAPKKPEGENENEEEKGLKGIGEMKQLTASGNLTFKGIHEDGSLIVVKGDRAFYDKAKQQFLIRGDYLEFRQGQAFNLKAKHKDAFIEFKFDGKRFKSGQLSKKGWEANHDATKVKK